VGRKRAGAEQSTTMPAVKEFGIAFESPRGRNFIAAARLAEELGFATFWVPEDPVFPGAFATAAAIAARVAPASKYFPIRSIA
jgi:alkanesulfonate monooxygenase SsuD/methylene tetrahydromethanopterin reductase-like flavin-dependent oxidoreductase (luciferase family)